MSIQSRGDVLPGKILFFFWETKTTHSNGDMNEILPSVSCPVRRLLQLLEALMSLNHLQVSGTKCFTAHLYSGDTRSSSGIKCLFFCEIMDLAWCVPVML